MICTAMEEEGAYTLADVCGKMDFAQSVRIMMVIIRLQARFRGRQLRREVDTAHQLYEEFVSRELEEIQQKERDLELAAAVKIQSMFRGSFVRQMFRQFLEEGHEALALGVIDAHPETEHAHEHCPAHRRVVAERAELWTKLSMTERLQAEKLRLRHIAEESRLLLEQELKLLGITSGARGGYDSEAGTDTDTRTVGLAKSSVRRQAQACGPRQAQLQQPLRGPSPMAAPSPQRAASTAPTPSPTPMVLAPGTGAGLTAHARRHLESRDFQDRRSTGKSPSAFISPSATSVSPATSAKHSPALPRREESLPVAPPMKPAPVAASLSDAFLLAATDGEWPVPQSPPAAMLTEKAAAGPTVLLSPSECEALVERIKARSIQQARRKIETEARAREAAVVNAAPPPVPAPAPAPARMSLPVPVPAPVVDSSVGGGDTAEVRELELALRELRQRMASDYVPSGCSPPAALLGLKTPVQSQAQTWGGSALRGRDPLSARHTRDGYFSPSMAGCGGASGPAEASAVDAERALLELRLRMVESSAANLQRVRGSGGGDGAGGGVGGGRDAGDEAARLQRLLAGAQGRLFGSTN